MNFNRSLCPCWSESTWLLWSFTHVELVLKKLNWFNFLQATRRARDEGGWCLLFYCWTYPHTTDVVMLAVFSSSEPITSDSLVDVAVVCIPLQMMQKAIWNPIWAITTTHKSCLNHICKNWISCDVLVVWAVNKSICHLHIQIQSGCTSNQLSVGAEHGTKRNHLTCDNICVDLIAGMKIHGKV